MYARLTPDLQPSLESKVKRLRITSALKHYPIAVALFGACAVLLLFTKAHGLVRLLFDALDDRFTEQQIITAVVVSIIVAVSIALIFLLRSMIQAPVFEQHYFCGPCNAVDKDDEGICPFCDQPLKHKETFFFTLYDDEILLADSFGLTPANETAITIEPPPIQ